ncbi:hypothetical protein HAX54_044123 [Datura stramonium]|uniref:Uncharacterized protein n=1 Tax=Datura stramonium TaxID=4076 RepID=A0ABS8W6P4_DATST|nr:hypothetical protein [Datura stramonium]
MDKTLSKDEDGSSGVSKTGRVRKQRLEAHYHQRLIESSSRKNRAIEFLSNPLQSIPSFTAASGRQKQKEEGNAQDFTRQKKSLRDSCGFQD